MGILVGAALSFTSTVKVVAQSTSPTAVITDDQVNAVAKQLYCPVCENIPLDVCPTTACAQWRDLIRQMLGEGKTVENIKQYFVVQYGTRVLAEPPRTGLNLLVYVLPPLAFLVGVFLVFRILRGVRRPKTVISTPGPAPASEDKYIAQIEEELRHRQ